MNSKKQEHFKKLLTDIKQKLTDDVKRSLDISKEEVNGGVPDIMDDAARTYNRQVILNLSEKERVELGRVDEALQKITDGRYGICEECEEHIPVKRLEIIPFAKLCVECESRMEENS
jgi:DnaK suppressor protein